MILESLPSLPKLTKMAYGWSKWEGAYFGLIGEFLKEWYCQGCGRKLTWGMPQFFVPLDNSFRNFIRVCSICKHRLVKKEAYRFEDLREEEEEEECI